MMITLYGPPEGRSTSYGYHLLPWFPVISKSIVFLPPSTMDILRVFMVDPYIWALNERHDGPTELTSGLMSVALSPFFLGDDVSIYR